jgi:hypothetical protein
MSGFESHARDVSSILTRRTESARAQLDESRFDAAQDVMPVRARASSDLCAGEELLVT